MQLGISKTLTPTLSQRERGQEAEHEHGNKHGNEQEKMT
jgi:hypothetical protein